MNDAAKALGLELVDQPSWEDFEDAATDLADAANYLKTNLDEGGEIYESKWLGALMEAHGLLLAAADSHKPKVT